MSRETVRAILTDPRFELLPFEGFEEEAAALPSGATVAVTSSPSKGVDESIDYALWLADRGYEVSAHVAARGIRDEDHLRETAERLSEAGIDDVFIPAGDQETPVGPYDSAYSLLSTLADLPYSFEEVGITGYPEGHQFLSDSVLEEHMQKKAPYATYVVTQMSFSPDAVGDWLLDVRERGIDLPVVVGVPGVMRYQRLLDISQRIGVGQSMQYLRKTTGLVDFIRQLIGSRGQYTPDSFVEGLAQYYDDPAYGIKNVHLYTFNQVEDLEQWRSVYL